MGENSMRDFLLPFSSGWPAWKKKIIFFIAHIPSILSALSSTCDFKSHFCKQCGPRSAVWSGSTLFACMQKIGLKSLQEYSADDINRRHFQM